MSGAKDALQQEKLLERNAADGKLQSFIEPSCLRKQGLTLENSTSLVFAETEASSSSSDTFLVSAIIATIVIALVPVYLLIAALLKQMRKRKFFLFDSQSSYPN